MTGRTIVLLSGALLALVAMPPQEAEARGQTSMKKLRKGKVRTVDIRPHVESLAVTGRNTIGLVLVSQEGRGSSKPVEILRGVLGLSEEQCQDAKILKT